ncbi:hypothetical protein HPB52_015937 [Rhipicephalus sanguineus]|uniref:Histone deacetylase complex subunit SAP130 C-terminal domain-containing protein n=1 Tax=Rhipicephalus sanguineus TaxID=34632 RepID=A0A9D4Q0S5_RHISA|nr:hypothetical protein HPB52_015937 [Rhipicephalus sanguineus]
MLVGGCLCPPRDPGLLFWVGTERCGLPLLRRGGKSSSLVGGGFITRKGAVGWCPRIWTVQNDLLGELGTFVGMSGVQKAPGSVELKLPDKGEQPMDLAPRTAHQHAAVAASAAKPTQLQVTTIGPALRPHLDTAKSAFTTLGQRLPASPRPVLQPAISVSSTGGNVIAASVTPSYTVKSVGGSSVPQLSTLRHMVTPSATGLSSPNAGTIVTSIASPMASIIRGNTITTTQIGHTLSHQFSSHVPRGPAAVASINTAPKSALATPMLRSSMSQASTAPHIPVGRTRPVYKMTRWIAKFHEPVEEFIREDYESAQQARAAGLVPARAAFPSMPRSAGLSMAQVMDLQKTYGVPRSGSHGGAGQVQIGFASGRSLEPLARTTLGHPSVSVAKSLHVTQPIVHSLHQVPEKTFKCNTSPATVQYTAVPGLAAGTTGHSAVIPSSPSPLTTSNSSTASCGATIVSPHAQVVQPSVPIRSNMGTMSLVTLAPTSAVQSAPQVVATSQPASLHGSNLATGGSGIHPIFTVVSNKSPLSVAPASTAPSIGIPQNRLAGASRLATTASPAVQPTSVQVAGSATRPITTTVAIHPPTMSVPTVSVVKTRSEDASKDDRRYVPGTKVFGPTSLVGSTAGMHSSSGLEATATVSEPTGNLFVTGATARNLATTISSASSNAPTTASALPATVVISDTRTDRPAQLQGAAATPSYAVPATYLYEPYPIQGATITMHPYAAATPAGVTPVFPVASARPSLGPLMSSGGYCSAPHHPCLQSQPSAEVELVVTWPLGSVPQAEKPGRLPGVLGHQPSHLCATELLDIHSTDGDDDMEKESLENLKKEFSRGDDMKCVAFCKRPSMSLLTSYSHNWKTRQNHFIRHSDVKPKDDKKQTVNDLANQKGVLQKANGWKVFHLTSQMEDVVDLEDTVHSKLSQLLNFIEDKPPAIRVKPLNMDEERILNKINDLIKGNLQRSKIVQDQVTEAKQQVLKVLDHKPRIVEIIGKYVSKRPLKKREKM